MKYIEKKIKKKINLENINILIIGGSRGIGAWITKLVTISGANVTMTYSSGKKEAELIKSDLLSIGLNCKIKKLSISDKHKIKLPSGKFDHLYYFPTPKIFGKQSDIFDTLLYKKYELFYSLKFESIALNYISKGLSKILKIQLGN